MRNFVRTLVSAKASTRRPMIMRNTILTLALFCCATLHAQVEFAETSCDLGTFAEDTVRLPRHTFTFINRGRKAVAPTEVKTSCGCLKADFDRRPVTPGGKGQITVTFRPEGHPGRFLRKLTVYFSNRPQPYILEVKGNVRPSRQHRPR